MSEKTEACACPAEKLALSPFSVVTLAQSLASWFKSKLVTSLKSVLQSLVLSCTKLKLLRQEGRCPATEGKAAKAKLIVESNKVVIPKLTVEGLVELYLT